jgi:ABC-type Na+ efflux pump, permease component
VFKNFDKVFSFTFHNQTKVKSYKSMTIILSILLLVVPIIIMYFVGGSEAKEDEGLKSCGAGTIYVVNKEAPNADFNMLNYLGVENYDNIHYINYDSVDEALEAAKGGPDIIIIKFEKVDGEMTSEMIIPESSLIDRDTASNYNDFIKQNTNFFAILASGISMTNLAEMSQPVGSDVYNISGYQKGVSLLEDKEASENIEANSVKSVFNYIVVFLTIMVLYFVILMYGNSISMHVVMEKESKLMDTMLISVHPEALVFGKMLGVLASGFLQLFAWLISLALGLFIGTKVVEATGGSLMLISFFKSMSGMGIFTISGVILAVITIIFGILLYATLSCIAGSISSNREEAASNNGIFVLVLVVSFYIVLFCGLGAADAAMPTWMMFVPPVAAMVLPASLLLGTIPMGIGALAVLLLVVTASALTILSGKLYKMMSLYKGNQVKLSKALKMLFSKA